MDEEERQRHCNHDKIDNREPDGALSNDPRRRKSKHN